MATTGAEKSKSSNIMLHAYIVTRFCAVADELNDRIYMIGGPKPWSKKQCRYYKVSTNTWHECVDKTLVEETYVSLKLLMP